MLAEILKQRLQQPLPGKDAHRLMIPEGRNLLAPIPADARQSGVMILLYELDKQWNTLLIRRTEDGRTHSGQISFPGGKMERKDTDVIHTALRECEEEIGVPQRNVEVLGTLSPVYIPPSHFLVTPSLGLLHGVPHYRPSEQEVQEIIQLPLNLLFSETIKKRRQVLPSFTPKIPIETPVYEPADDLIVWGATAMMIAELETVLREDILNPYWHFPNK